MIKWNLDYIHKITDVIPWFLSFDPDFPQLFICLHWFIVIEFSELIISSDLFLSAAAAAAAFLCLLRLFLCWWLPDREFWMAWEFMGWLVPPCPNRRPFPEMWLLLKWIWIISKTGEKILRDSWNKLPH